MTTTSTPPTDPIDGITRVQVRITGTGEFFTTIESISGPYFLADGPLEPTGRAFIAVYALDGGGVGVLRVDRYDPNSVEPIDGVLIT